MTADLIVERIESDFILVTFSVVLLLLLMMMTLLTLL